MEPTTFQKFVPFAKVDAAKQEVWGVVTAEVPDKDGEICDYASTKPYYKTWSEEFVKSTDGKSCGNLRYMHQLKAVGKGIGIEFRDDDKEIWMGFKVTDDPTWKDVEEGVLTGFSQGGRYVKGPDSSKRYTANPHEVSVVDNPALGVAHFAYIKSDGSVEMRKVRSEVAPQAQIAVPLNQYVNLGGVGTNVPYAFVNVPYAPPPQPDVAQIVRSTLDEFFKAEKKTKRVAGEDLPASAFAYVGDAEKTETWKLPIQFSSEEKTKSHIRNALARFSQTEGIPADERPKVLARIKAAAKKHGISTDTADKVLAAHELLGAAEEEIRKGMYDVARFAQLLQGLTWLQQMAEREKAEEEDESEVPLDLLDRIKDLVAVFLDMAREEAEELTLPDSDDASPMYYATHAQVTKISRLLARAAASNSKEAGTPAKGVNTMSDLSKGAGLLDHLRKAKDMADDHNEKMKAHIDKCMGKVEGSKEEEDEAEKAAKAAAAKAAQATIPPVTASSTAAAVEQPAFDKALTSRFEEVVKGMQERFDAMLKKYENALEPPKAAATTKVVTKAQDGAASPEEKEEELVEPSFQPAGTPSLGVSDQYRKALRSVKGVAVTQ